MAPFAAPSMTRADVTLGLATAAVVALTAGQHLVAATPPGGRAAPFVLLYELTLVAMLVATRATPSASPGAMRAMLAGGVVARWSLVPIASFTTTDVSRYLWDGWVVLHGADPYRLAPDAPALAPLRHTFPWNADHHDVVTCYPPLALACFALAASCGPALAALAWKALCALASTVAARLAWHHDGAQRPYAALVVLAPWMLTEGGIGAHLDILLVPFILGAVQAREAERHDRAAMLYGVAIALKWVPLIGLPALVVSAPRRARFVALALSPAALTWAAARALGLRPPGSLAAVAEVWEFGAPLYRALAWVLPYFPEVVRSALTVATVCGVGLVAITPRRLDVRLRDSLGLQLFASPTSYPWYGLGFAALLSSAPSYWALAFLAISPLSYEVLDLYQTRGLWAPARWPVVALGFAWLWGVVADAAAGENEG
ncbi:MAG: DUF2029 domain-containing protein [Myxococcales bacterium]|nr:DUF2029 domain-containing protein [Myxococcales bacterium]